MKIAVFSDTFFPQINGVSRVLGKYLDYMDSKEIEYILFVPEKEQGRYKGSIVSLGGVTFPLYPELKIANPSKAKLNKYLENFHPDLVHLVTQFSVGLAGMRYAQAHNLPIISSYHTNLDQYLSYYHLSLLAKPLNKYLQWFHSFSQINFCPSQETMHELEAKGMRNLEVCPNGVDPEFFSPQFRNNQIRKDLSIDDNTHILLYVGRIAGEKGLDVLLKAVKSLDQLGVSYRLIMVGDGPAREQMSKADHANVNFVGYKTGRELQEIYASADIFVFPSTTETFGNVILEAMCSGLPVVAARAGGVKDNVIDMYNGLTFEPGNPADMAKAIKLLIEDRELFAQMAANAATYALSKTWNAIFDRFFARLQEFSV